MNYRHRILKIINRYFPIDFRGDAEVSDMKDKDISCVINFYGRTGLLKNILAGLNEQDYPKDKFEVVLVEDRNGTEEGRKITEEFSCFLDIKYIPLEKNFGKMGYSRNTGISNSAGKYILLLDDDTVILQKDFLSLLLAEFDQTGADVILPRGIASFCIVNNKYQYHDPYFPTNRCVAYKRETISELGGFVSEIVGQEDVEFTVRLIAFNKKLHNSDQLEYYHPPLIVENSSKAEAVGYSFAGLRGRYPLVFWLLLILNGSRYLPLTLLPFNEKFKHYSRFSAGFLRGFVYYFLGKDVNYS